MKKPYLFIVLFYFFLSCDRNPDPSVEVLSEYSFSYQFGQGKKLFAGELVSDSIKFFAVNLKNRLKDSVEVRFEVVNGGGNITNQKGYTDKNGNVFTGWKLGYDSFEQKLRASTYNLSGDYLTSSDLIAYGFRTGEWDALTGTPDASMTGMAADTVNKVTFMVTNNSLYKQGSRYFLWEKVADPALISPRIIEKDCNGVFYVSTWSGEVVKSINHGVSWVNCTKPYPDRLYSIEMYVSNDNQVWVYAQDHKIKFSRDGGTSWTEIGSGITSQGFGDVFRLKDASLLFHGSNCCSLCRSFDDGLTWKSIETPGYSVKLFVNDKDEIFICTQLNGISLYKSTDYGASFILTYSVKSSFGTTMDNIYNKWDNKYYISIPGYGILISSDLTNFEDFWVNNNLENLFIDHNGVFIAKKFWSNTVYYRKN